MNRGIEHKVVIMAGSDSDKPHIEKIADSLKKYNIPHEVRICSAHKQLERFACLIDEYNEFEGVIGYVAVAGGTDALSGTLSYNVLGPVVSCPPDSFNESCLRNPSGSSNAYIQNPQNVGRFFAQMFSGIDSGYRMILRREKTKKAESLIDSDAELKKEFQFEGVVV